MARCDAPMDGSWELEHGGYWGGVGVSRSHGLRGNKDPSLPPQLDVHGRGDPNTHQPTRLAGNCLGRRLRPGGLSKEGGFAGDVPDSHSLTPGPSSTSGTHSRLGASSASPHPHCDIALDDDQTSSLGKPPLWQKSPAKW